MYRITRHFFIDDLLASLTRELIPVAAVPDLDIALHSVESVDMVLRQLGGVRPVRAWCRASLDIPPTEVLRELRIEASVPVWRIDSVNRDARRVRCCSAAAHGRGPTRSGWSWSWRTSAEMETVMTDPLDRAQRCGLLAVAEPDELRVLADACLADGVDVRVLVAPEVGCVSTQVREPVAGERFLIGDVLACRAEVELAGQRGWAMRLGRRPCVRCSPRRCWTPRRRRAGPRAADVDELCRAVARRQADRDEREWAELAPTIVEFEELT